MAAPARAENLYSRTEMRLLAFRVQLELETGYEVLLTSLGFKGLVSRSIGKQTFCTQRPS